MFTFIGIGIIGIVAFLSNRAQNKDAGSSDDDLRHMRQDIRVVVWLLAGVVFMLGIVADRMH